MDTQMTADEVFDGGFTIELYPDGTGKIISEGEEDTTFTWKEVTGRVFSST